MLRLMDYLGRLCPRRAIAEIACVSICIGALFAVAVNGGL